MQEKLKTFFFQLDKEQ